VIAPDHCKWGCLPLCLLLLLAASPAAIAQSKSTGTGTGTIETIRVATGVPGRRATLKVWTYRPRTLMPDSRVLIVVHGASRNAGDYLDAWIPTADKRNLLLLAPSFTKSAWPAYNRGRLFRGDGTRRPREQSAFGAMEKAFDEAVRRYGNRQRNYYIFGHSAGAQFVHRLVMLYEGHRATRAAAANAGWYTLPTLQASFPYGLRDIGIADADIRRMLGEPLTVVLGLDDIDPHHHRLRQDAGASAQGRTRLARGRNFLEVARSQANRTGAVFNWPLIEVPGVAHNHKKIVPAAARALFGDD
jgi:poly(3-hydroxybutyrate) depolymerase